MRWLTLVGLGLMGLTCFAQETKDAPKNEQPKKFYKLDFVAQEVEGGNVVNSRSYSITVRSKDKGFIRAGEKVPTGNQMFDVGVLIDCQELEEETNGVSARVRAEISGTVDVRGTGPSMAPIVTHQIWESYVTLPLRHPTVLFSSDETASKRTMRLQLTVTPIP